MRLRVSVCVCVEAGGVKVMAVELSSAPAGEEGNARARVSFDALS